MPCCLCALRPGAGKLRGGAAGWREYFSEQELCENFGKIERGLDPNDLEIEPESDSEAEVDILNMEELAKTASAFPSCIQKGLREITEQDQEEGQEGKSFDYNFIHEKKRSKSEFKSIELQQFYGDEEQSQLDFLRTQKAAINEAPGRRLRVSQQPGEGEPDMRQNRKSVSKPYSMNYQNIQLDVAEGEARKLSRYSKNAQNY